MAAPRFTFSRALTPETNRVLMTRKALILDRPGSRPRVVPESPARGWAFVVKVALMALVDALGVYLVLKFIANDRELAG